MASYTSREGRSAGSRRAAPEAVKDCRVRRPFADTLENTLEKCPTPALPEAR
ncbi:MAG TPA: hypothetical protein VMU14_16845 [Acidimicrobiales bacterium]|nr:hypothetical protein [Acidimicrobiales bacterium]